MLGQLVPCGGGRPIPLFQPFLVVGRQSSCDIPLCFPTVSSRHCELEFRDGYWYVRDLESKNGTRVNGKVCGSERLMPNDILSVAGYRYTIVYTPAAEGTRSGRVDSPRAEPARVSPPVSPRPAARPVPQTAQGSAGSPVGQLVPCGGGDPIPLRKAKLVVGRDAGCDVVIRTAAVSGRHCQLEWTGGGWLVRDLGSKTGIRVDGIPCEEQMLPAGCVLSIGNLRYRVVYSFQETGPRSGPRAPVFGKSLLEAAGLVHWGAEPPAGGKGKRGEEEMEPRPRWSLDDPA
jgi:pSer/pThr/pTyr-binding forkhead associated (FHA) protein